MIKTEHHPQFFTATILEWKHLLANDLYKQVILNSLRFLVNDKRVVVNGFVIMSNHIHLIWQAMNGFTPKQLQHSLLSFTANKITQDLQLNNQELLQELRVNAKDRQYQVWERNALSVDLFSEEVYLQKLNYIHNNPVTAGLCNVPGNYKYSSAAFYETLFDEFGFLTHWRG